MELSNRAIAVLLITAMTIYIGGTFISMNRMADFPRLPPTALATADGNVSLEIKSETSIIWVVSAIHWGTGYVDTGCDSNCTMFVNSTASQGNSPDSFDSACCKEFNWTNHSLLLRNNGNQDVNLQMNITTNVTDWFDTETPAEFSFKIVDAKNRVHDNADVNDTTESCLGNGSHSNGWNNYNSSSDWTALDTWKDAPVYICGDVAGFNFTYESTKNEANFDFKVVIPQTYSPGGSNALKSTLITILATAAG